MANRPAILKPNWPSLTTEKDGLLIGATHFFILVCRWRGKVSSANLHDLPFPRSGLKHPVTGKALPDDEVPKDIEFATVLFGDHMHKTNPLAEPGTAGVKRARIEGVVDFTPDNNFLPRQMPFEIMKLLEPYTVSISMPDQRTQVYGV